LVLGKGAHAPLTYAGAVEEAGVRVTGDEIVAQLREVFAKVPRPGLPPGYMPDGRLGNPGWDEFTYHSALVFAEQVPDHVKRAFESPAERIPDLLWHLSDSERLGVFSNSQVEALISALAGLEAAHPDVTGDPAIAGRLRTVRSTLERLASRPE
jgi:hypothetical protein